MQVLIIGCGGREHALAWKIAQSPQVDRVYVAPGNGGTASVEVSGDTTARISNLGLSRLPDLIAFAKTEGIALTVVGPEAPLAAGAVDAFQAAGLDCFGPSQAAARLEGSKAFAKEFMDCQSIPTARYTIVHDYAAGLDALHRAEYPVVVKASGLAAGKGVIVPETLTEAETALAAIMVERAFGAAGDQVVLEERLSGQEVSVLAFCDGKTVAIMPPAQDHKAVFDGDRGPNTGGMGAYAPAPIATPALLSEVAAAVLQPVVDGMAAAGTPYVGVLYAGLMLTTNGPRVLEFNCRFGDPETQVILPLLETDLVDVLNACLDGRLADCELHWRSGAAATVVAASEGYPGDYPKGREITGVEAADSLPDTVVFHAGTHRDATGRLLTDGGRVLAVTGVAESLPDALARAYAGLGRIRFAGMHYRRDIGAKAVTWR